MSFSWGGGGEGGERVFLSFFNEPVVLRLFDNALLVETLCMRLATGDFFFPGLTKRIAVSRNENITIVSCCKAFGLFSVRAKSANKVI